MSDIQERIKGIDITEEMQKSYLDYAMSVIVARALPDVRDGLKPVHRRILYAMSELNLTPSSGYKKSARIVGDTMGKYHPHGDSSIYDAMVRMAQDWSMRYVLVDGHGNFGSMDGDAAAAHRYTEARLSKLSMEMLTDIEKETVDFAPNYDEQFMEPTVLPARFPNLLVNGAMGIAVGMSTSIPPHNLTDVVNAVLHRIADMREGVETEIRTLIDIVKAPDYPTGGAILGTESIREAYRTGRGKVILRADATIEPLPGQSGREQIRVTAIPYQVNKANLVIKMAELVKDKKIDGITDIRDESNRNGVRIIIELRKDANANVVLNKLYKLSPLQESHGIIMLALVKNEPKILNLAEMINYYIEHQQEVITRRTQFDLAKAERRAHIVEGLLKALDHVDEIIKILRSHNDETDVAPILMEKFGLTEIQVKAILDLRWRALLRLARAKLEDEHKALMELIAELRKILADGNYLLEVLTEELTKIRDKFGDARRSQIVFDPSEINIEDLIDDAQSVITLSHLNYIKRIPLDAYRNQGRGGRGIIGAPTREEDWVTDLFVANTHDNVLFFTSLGRAFSLRAFEIPEAGRQAKGMPLVNLLNLSSTEKIAAMIPVTKNDWDGFLIMVTKKGLVKRTALELYSRIRKGGLNAITFREDDTLIEVLRSDGERELFLATQQGRGIRFEEAQARAVGRTAMGVRGMKLRENDEIIGATVADGQVLLASTNGYGKVTPVESFRGQNRGGYGTIAYKPSPKTGNLIGIEAVSENDGLIIINSDGVIIRIRVADISVQGRYASGVKLINMNEDTTIVSIAKIPDGGEDEAEEIETTETTEQTQE
ncbi:MAG: DNA gyrase subunit A [Defluviitaleaceae bacterium]|nr:DNA gyrase subunit A [Defluviitaleaceae bacterium]MCL2261881.1 DNA gyrase subunit A [Defluviitaleaceae bacterium]